MTRSLEPEPRPAKPTDFDGWYDEIGLFADCQGEIALLGVVLTHAPLECVRYFGAEPGLFAALLVRARYADWRRYCDGVTIGRRVGL